MLQRVLVKLILEISLENDIQQTFQIRLLLNRPDGFIHSLTFKLWGQNLKKLNSRPFQYRAITMLIISTTLGFAMATLPPTPAKSELRRHLESHVSPREFLLKYRKSMQNQISYMDRLIDGWTTLQLTFPENWINPTEEWPNEMFFEDFLGRALVEVKSSALGEDKQIPNPEALSKLNLEIDASGFSSHSLRSPYLAANLIVKSLNLYRQAENLLELATENRLALEELHNQHRGLELDRNNGYYLKEYDKKSQALILATQAELEELFTKMKEIRTTGVVPLYDTSIGLVNGISTRTYQTVGELKTDIRLIQIHIETTTPLLTAFRARLQAVLKSLDTIKTRASSTKNWNPSDSKDLATKVETLIQQASALAKEEHTAIENDNPDIWQLWYDQNRSRYEEVFYQLYEILESTTKRNSPLYNFQKQFFQLNSKNRQIYRHLEALLFGETHYIKVRDFAIRKIVSLEAGLPLAAISGVKTNCAQKLVGQ